LGPGKGNQKRDSKMKKEPKNSRHGFPNLFDEKEANDWSKKESSRAPKNKKKKDQNNSSPGKIKKKS
jgi:hypothetical protein